jgi:hypothetical protein
MSWQPAEDPKPGDRFGCDAIETVIMPRARDLGGFEVRRALPSANRQMVGPFIFWDQMGPAEFLLGQGVDVRPHPHMGLRPSPTCSMARSCTATASARSRPSGPAPST